MDPTQVKCNISVPVIGVVETSGRGVLGDHRQDLSSASRGGREGDYLPVLLVNAENDGLSNCTPSAVSGAISTEHRFIQLENSILWAGQFQAVLVQTDPEQLVEVLNGLLAHAHQKAKPIGRYSQAKVLDQPGFMLSGKSTHLLLRFGRKPL